MSQACSEKKSFLMISAQFKIADYTDDIAYTRQQEDKIINVTTNNLHQANQSKA